MRFIERARGINKAARIGLALSGAVAAAGPAQVLADSEVGIIPQGKTDLSVTVDQFKAVVFRSQEIQIAGNTFTVNPRENPGAVIVVGVVSGRGVVIPASLAAGMASGIHFSDVPAAATHPQRVSELRSATKAQVGRSFGSGECGSPAGCDRVRAIELVASQENGELTFDLVSDTEVKNPGVSTDSQPKLEPTPAPKYPDNADEAAKFFGGKADQWKKNPQGGWNFNSPNEEVVVSPASYTMDGYNKEGIFVATGVVLVKANGGSVWKVQGPEEVDKLKAAVSKNNPGKEVKVLGQ